MAHFNDLHIREYPLPPTLAWKGKWVKNWFSNFEAVGHPVAYRGRRTRVLEVAFVAAKNPDQMVPTADGQGTQAFIDRVFAAATPGEAKGLGAPASRGGIVQLRPDWDEVNLAAMDLFLRQRWQPGHRDTERLLALPAPIVEWNNWRDNRWGATIDTRRGRDALGLLLELLCAELATGRLAPGAEEAFWRERQEELVARLNALRPDTVVGARKPAGPQQLGLF